jgi:dienelactone hydrolase
MQKETSSYSILEKEYKGHWTFPISVSSKQKRPLLLIAPTWMGQDNFIHQQAEKIARLGYIAFVVDLYGDGKSTANPIEAGQLMHPLFKERAVLQERMHMAYQEAYKNPFVDTQKIGAIGFCFGGLAVIELLRSGIDVKRVVSFHGVLGNTLGSLIAQDVPIAPVKGSLLILHGYEDPLISQEDIYHVQQELTQAGVDWQMHIYSHTSHAFTNPSANDSENGLCFNSLSAQRSWQAMCNFFAEEFGD